MQRKHVGAAHELDLALVLALAEGAHACEHLGRVGVLGVAGGAERVCDKRPHAAVEDERAVAPHIVHEHGVRRLALGPRQPAHADVARKRALARTRLLKLGREDHNLRCRGVGAGGHGDEERALALRPRARAEPAEKVLDAWPGLGNPHRRVRLAELGGEAPEAARVQPFRGG